MRPRGQRAPESSSPSFRSANSKTRSLSSPLPRNSVPATESRVAEARSVGPGQLAQNLLMWGLNAFSS